MRKITKFFLVSLLSMVMVFNMAACSKKEEATTGKTDDGKKTENNSNPSGGDKVATDEKEAPMLAEQVASGKLPKLEERLPAASDVMVEPDIQELGTYGGSLVMTTHDHAHWTWGPCTEQSMFRFKQDASGKAEPNVAKDFYANDDSTVWTIELREGMRWSDGEPFTADDVIFYYDHMSTPALNEDRTPLAKDDPNYYNAFTSKPYKAYQVSMDGKTYWAKFDKVDDYKFTVTFAAPKPSFPENVAVDNKWLFAPKHFYKNLVARKDGVTDDATFPLITEEQAIANANELLEREWDSYSKMGKSTGYYNWDYYQIPQLRSFIAVKNNWDKVGETYELVRNPYFFKTDSEGRQLPYLDSIKIQIINESDQATLKAVAGEFDVHEIMQASDFSVIASSTKETHRVSKWNGVLWASKGFTLNQTVKDMDKRTLYQDIRFREALSIAVDRELLSATVANNQLKSWQLSPGDGMTGYNEEWSKKWTAFDLEKANQILNEITEPWDGSEGTFRKFKGTDKDIDLVFNIQEDKMELNAEFLALLQTAYRKIGIKVLDKVQTDVAKTILANEHDVTVDLPYGSTPVLRPDAMVPMRNYMGWYGAYGKWYEDNRSEVNGGITPTGDMLAIIEAYDAIASANGPDREKIVEENTKKIYDLHAKNIWAIGFLEPQPERYMVNKNLKNFPDNLVKADEFRTINLARPEQFYMAK